MLADAKFFKTVFECARIVRVLFMGSRQPTEVFLLGVTSKIQLLCCLFVSGRKIEKVVLAVASF